MWFGQTCCNPRRLGRFPSDTLTQQRATPRSSGFGRSRRGDPLGRGTHCFLQISTFSWLSKVQRSTAAKKVARVQCCRQLDPSSCPLPTSFPSFPQVPLSVAVKKIIIKNCTAGKKSWLLRGGRSMCNHCGLCARPRINPQRWGKMLDITASLLSMLRHRQTERNNSSFALQGNAATRRLRTCVSRGPRSCRSVFVFCFLLFILK